MTKKFKFNANEDGVKISIGICAYNEEKNIAKLLDSILSPQYNIEIVDIIIIASGCIDNTVPIIEKYKAQDPRIKIIIEEQRLGKASAVNLFMEQAKCDIRVLASADIIVEKYALTYLVEAFTDSEVGMTGARVSPINSKHSLVGYAVMLQWRLHHLINIENPKNPKIGELVAFRNLHEKIQKTTSVDEVSIQAAVKKKGYKTKYIPKAVIINKGPESVFEFISQRRRIFSGHTSVYREQHYKVATYNSLFILKVLLKHLEYQPRYLLYTFGTIMLEGTARLLGYLDYLRGSKRHIIWTISSSTKSITNSKS